jgi:hypothetical protein
MQELEAGDKTIEPLKLVLDCTARVDLVPKPVKSPSGCPIFLGAQGMEVTMGERDEKGEPPLFQLMVKKARRT